MKNRSTNVLLATIAFVLALFGMLFSFTNPPGVYDVNINPRFMSVVDLAEKIKRRTGLQVIDLREDELFEQFHIPTAKNIPWKKLDLFTAFPVGQLVFYSDALPSQRIWSRLPDSLKDRSAILYGGIHDWYDHLLYPSLPAKAPERDSVIYHQVQGLSLFFGGQPQFSEGESMEYYHRDLGTITHSSKKGRRKLVRKGC